MNFQKRLERTVVSGNIMDLLLRHVAGRLDACLRQTDTVGRSGHVRLQDGGILRSGRNQRAGFVDNVLIMR